MGNFKYWDWVEGVGEEGLWVVEGEGGWVKLFIFILYIFSMYNYRYQIKF